MSDRYIVSQGEDFEIVQEDRAYLGPSVSIFKVDGTTGVISGNAIANVAIDGSVSTAKLADGAVTTAKLATNAVTTVKITDANITAAKLENLLYGTTAKSGAGVVPITHRNVMLTSTGAGQAITLADGALGQRIMLVHDVDGGSMVLTPTTKSGFTTITFTGVGETASLLWTATRGWTVEALFLAVAA